MKSNEELFRKEEVLQLPDPIVCTRTYPVTQHGDELLRACRRHITENIQKNSKKNIKIPFPTALYMVLRRFAEIEGVEIKDEDRIPTST